MVSQALVDDLLQRGELVLLVETDTSVPDVWRSCGKLPGVAAFTLDLDNVDGWIVLSTTIFKHPQHVVVINTAARNQQGIVAYGPLLQKALSKLNRRLVTLWVINRQRDSLELLEDYLAVLTESVTHVVRNGYFGPTAKFELYNASPYRKRIEANGGQSLTFPDLADRVCDQLYTQRLAIAQALDDEAERIDFGSRIELERWREEVRALFAEIVSEPLQAGGPPHEATGHRESTAERGTV